MHTYTYTSTTVVGWGSVNTPPLRVLKGTNKVIQLPNLLYLAGCTNRTRHSKTECYLIGVLLMPCKSVHVYHHHLWCMALLHALLLWYKLLIVASTHSMFHCTTYNRQPLLCSSSGCHTFSSALERTRLIPSPTYVEMHGSKHCRHTAYIEGIKESEFRKHGVAHLVHIQSGYRELTWQIHIVLNSLPM